MTGGIADVDGGGVLHSTQGKPLKKEWARERVKRTMQRES